IQGYIDEEGIKDKNLDLVGEQRVRLLGPFRVNYDDEGAEPNGDGLIVGPEIAAGKTVIGAWAVIITAWDGLGDEVGNLPQLTIDVFGPHGFGANQPGVLGESFFACRPDQGGYG